MIKCEFTHDRVCETLYFDILYLAYTQSWKCVFIVYLKIREKKIFYASVGFNLIIEETV